MEILINKCYGGYGLSDKAVRLYLTKKNIPIVVNRQYSGKYHTYYVVGLNNQFCDHHISRTDPVIIEVVRELGAKANGSSAKLEIELIPDGCKYWINEYDGMESIGDEWFEVTKEEMLKGVSPERLEQLLQATSIKIVD
jgi:hypothetical protein